MRLLIVTERDDRPVRSLDNVAGCLSKVADADAVITTSGRVLKDRYGQLQVKVVA